MDEGAFDVVIIGTGLTESIISAALSKAGFKVAHIDENPYYGADEACLSLDEFIQWLDDSSHSETVSRVSRSDVVLPQSRQYSISLAPSVIPSIGPFITSLVSSGVSRYSGFRLVEHVGIFDSSGKVRTVPSSKEDVFKNKTINLVDKRRLMRFLMFAAGEFEEKQELEGKTDMPFVDFLKSVFFLNEEVATTIAYALCHCVSPYDTTLPSLQRLRRYLRSTGRYGASPFLIGHYGSSGEIAQGFCRTSAVSGGVYILGKKISSVTCSLPGESDTQSSNGLPAYTIHLSDLSEPLTCNLIISSPLRASRHLTSHVRQVSPASSYDISDQRVAVARCVAIIDVPLSFTSLESEVGSSQHEVDEDRTAGVPSHGSPIDTGILVFPPSSLPDGPSSGSVIALVVGGETLSTPKGKWIIYISAPLQDGLPEMTPEALIKPYLDATLTFSTDDSTSIIPLFTAYYIQHPAPVPASSESSLDPSVYPTCLLVPQLPLHPLPEPPDMAALYAEAVFWEATHVLESCKLSTEKEKERDKEEVQSFWPLLTIDEDNDEVF